MVLSPPYTSALCIQGISEAESDVVGFIEKNLLRRACTMIASEFYDLLQRPQEVRTLREMQLE